MQLAHCSFRTPDPDAPTVVPSSAALSAMLGPPVHPGADPTDVAWWVHDGVVPTLADARRRFAFLVEHGSSPYAFTSRGPREALLLDRVSLDDVDVQLLIAQLNADLYRRYPEPGALVFSLVPGDLVEGMGMLLLATHVDRPVGCGAFRVLTDLPATAEVKRMYVAPSARGHKIGAAVLEELEWQAVRLGIERLVLETGPRQPEALQRYGRAGFVACEPWGEFVGKELSICMEKKLTG